MSTIPEGYEAITVGMNLTGRTIRFLKTVEWQGYDPSDNGFLEYDGINGYFLKTNAGDIALLSNGADVNVQYYSTLPGVEFGENKINYSGFGFATTMPYSPININTDYIITGENAVVTYIHEVNEALDWDINDYIVVKSVVQKYITLDNLQEFLAKCDERYQKATEVKDSTIWESRSPVLGAGVFGYDTTNKITKIGDGSTPWNALPAFSTTERSTFATAAWGDISRIAAAGDAQKYFNVGDEKAVELSTGEVITLVILGFNHDDLTSGGKAPITIGMKNLLATKYAMNSSSTNEGGWNGSAMRTSTMATLLSQLPADLRNVIKSVNKKATSGGISTTIKTSSDKLFLFSEVEIDGTTSSGYASEGEQYEYWKTVKDGKTPADKIKYLSNGGGSAGYWWLRSPRVDKGYAFRYVSSAGYVSVDYANITYGVSFGFCV